MVISSEGLFQAYNIDLENGGECSLMKEFASVLYLYSIKLMYSLTFFFGTTGCWVARILEMDPAGFKTFF